MNRNILIGVFAVVLLVAAVLYATWPRQPGPSEPADRIVAEEAGKGPAEAATGKPEAPEAEERAAEAAKADASKPSFDIVRISPEGEAVIAGRAIPGAEVTVLNAGEPLGMVTADSRGDWAIAVEKPLATGDTSLTLSARAPDGTVEESETVVVLVVPAEPRRDRVTGVAAAPPAERPVAILVPREGAGQTRLLQAPEPGPGFGTGDLRLQVVDYDEAGNLRLAGTGRNGTSLHAYLDNEAFGTARVGEDGGWSMTPDRPVAPGTYTLRIDQIEKGKVSERIELPFSRSPPIATMPGDAFVVVQPGNSLWRMARRSYGEGPLYTEIYQANKEQIRDPDLIYPGQIFAVPQRP